MQGALRQAMQGLVKPNTRSSDCSRHETHKVLCKKHNKEQWTDQCQEQCKEGCMEHFNKQCKMQC